MTVLFLAWRAPGRQWYPVGRLVYMDRAYSFAYVHGAELAQADGFRPLVEFPAFNREYHSTVLFPLFSNRLPPQTRPEYRAFLEWLNLAPGGAADIELLARSEGRRATDTLQVFPKPVPDARGRYRVHAFVHGLQYRDAEARRRAATLTPGVHLSLDHEHENPEHEVAVRALTQDTRHHIGYLPRYLAADVHALGLENIVARVKRVNRPPVPVQFRVLCELTAPWPEGFDPCTAVEFQPVTSPVARV